MKTEQPKLSHDHRDSKVENEKKPPFVEPKVTYIEPKVVKHGSVDEITAAFFGTFYP